MCRNHSHLIATYVGENTQGEVPVLMFVLANPVLTIEAPGNDGGTLNLQTSGMLYVPASMLAGLSAFHPQATAGQLMSLFFSLEPAPIIIAAIAKDLTSYCETSPAPSNEAADYLTQDEVYIALLEDPER